VPNLTQFVPLHGGPTSPDFTNGSPITFGYLATTGGAGFYESITGIDNDPITLTISPVAPSVPEPGASALLGSGLLSLAGLYRLKASQPCNRLKNAVMRTP
jgi:hypothetical protein